MFETIVTVFFILLSYSVTDFNLLIVIVVLLSSYITGKILGLEGNNPVMYFSNYNNKIKGKNIIASFVRKGTKRQKKYRFLLVCASVMIMLFLFFRFGLRNIFMENKDFLKILKEYNKLIKPVIEPIVIYCLAGLSLIIIFTNFKQSDIKTNTEENLEERIKKLIINKK
ncbi:MAG: hypothetical protein N4A38_02240 [Candidatus Gracilibacteria bacterium]|nr:hypothetical protein [Candidatus Gracilibacteria bacterium]